MHMSEISTALRIFKRLSIVFKRDEIVETLVGYENPILVDQIVYKTLIRSQQIKNGDPLEISELRIFLGMLCSHPQSQVVVDFGGGAGTHFDALSSAFPEIDFSYYVIETPEMSRKASDFRSTDKKLHFLTLDEIDQLPKSIDLLVANSSLQYTDSPIQTLTVLGKLKPRKLWITRFPLNESDGFFSIRQISKLDDNGPGHLSALSNQLVEYVANVVSLRSFEEELTRNFDVTMKVIEERNPYGGEYKTINSYGYLAKLKI